MSDDELIKYVFIGDPNEEKEIGHYPESGTPKDIKEEVNKIFRKVSNSGMKKEQRNNISEKDKGNYYCKINSENIFMLILASEDFTQSEAYDLMDKIQKENIPILIDAKTGKLNLYGRQNLKDTVEDYVKNRGNRIKDLQKDVIEVSNIMKRNLTKAIDNTKDLEKMEEKAIQLKKGAADYNSNASSLKRTTWWATFKWYIILAAVIILLLIIILPISLSKKK